MNAKLIEEVANAVLYEGYMLYPYRPSAVKNRQRWNFGVLYPRAYSEEQNGADSWLMQTQCLVRGGAEAVVHTQVRFLQSVSRQMGQVPKTTTESTGDGELEFALVDTLEVGSRLLHSWQEAVERDVALPSICLADVIEQTVRQQFSFSGGRELVFVRDDAGSIAGVIVRTREEIKGCVEISAEICGEDLFRLKVVITNLANFEAAGSAGRERVLLQSLLSAHTILGVTPGEFISLIDPPSAYQQAASECRNIGTWPVLIGEEHATDAMLSSPIILYDYPQIAPESPGNLFDGTEIDEILALRILTLTDDEKREIRRSDERAREVLERTESMPEEHLLKLHGVLRGMKRIGGDATGAGHRDER